MIEALKKGQPVSTMKKLQEAKLKKDYADSCTIFDRIPFEIIRAYTQHGTGRRRLASIANWNKDE